MAESLCGLRTRQGSLEVVRIKIEELLSGEKEDLLLLLSACWHLSTAAVALLGSTAGVKK